MSLVVEREGVVRRPFFSGDSYDLEEGVSLNRTVDLSVGGAGRAEEVNVELEGRGGEESASICRFGAEDFGLRTDGMRLTEVLVDGLALTEEAAGLPAVFSTSSVLESDDTTLAFTAEAWSDERALRLVDPDRGATDVFASLARADFGLERLEGDSWGTMDDEVGAVGESA